MARKERTTQVTTLLFVWGISSSTLRAAMLTRGKRVDLTGEYVPLDSALVMLLHEKKRELEPLRGIGVVVDELGSFASSRILLATLNIYAWLRDVPIIAVPAEWEQKDADTLNSIFNQAVGRTKHFSTQLLPRYQRSADITVSKKRNKFHIT